LSPVGKPAPPRPRKPDALTNAQRQAAFRARRKAAGKAVTVTKKDYDEIVLEHERLREALAKAEASHRPSHDGAPHAALAITNARLYERTSELSIVTERNRLALELHDAVSQKLFALVLTTEAAETLLDREPEPGAVRARHGER